MTQLNTDLIPMISESFGLDIKENVSGEELVTILSSHINLLIETDFQKLVSILYRIDISESKLSQVLKDNPGTDAGSIIAELMIERQLQKIKSRQQFGNLDNNISDEEKW